MVAGQPADAAGPPAYEAAVRLANAAERAAREALDSAKSQAQRRQQIEAQRQPQTVLPQSAAPQATPTLQAEADDPTVQEIRV